MLRLHNASALEWAATTAAVHTVFALIASQKNPPILARRTITIIKAKAVKVVMLEVIHLLTIIITSLEKRPRPHTHISNRMRR